MTTRTVNARTARKKVAAPRCIVIEGPNGAGKTTFARQFLPKDAGVVHFVNADLIPNHRANSPDSSLVLRMHRSPMSRISRQEATLLRLSRFVFKAPFAFLGAVQALFARSPKPSAQRRPAVE